MKTVNVLVGQDVGAECLRIIREVSPALKVVDASALVTADLKGNAAASKQLDTLLAEAEVIFTRFLPRNVIGRAPRLKWLQVMSAGVDRYLAIEDLRKSPVVLSGVSGLHAVTISEFVIGLILMFAKESARCFGLKQQHRWSQFPLATLPSKTLGVIGLGHIGSETARLGKAFGMKVIATRRSAKPGAKARYVDMLLPREQLPRLLSESDFVAITLPFTPETTSLIGEKELRAMKKTAYLINIGRGGIIDETALIRALKGHWIAGAGLDVFATEPLPPESPLWDLPNIIMSSHVSGHLEDYDMRASLIFRDNMQRYLSGRRLKNKINKSLGY